MSLTEHPGFAVAKTLGRRLIDQFGEPDYHRAFTNFIVWTWYDLRITLSIWTTLMDTEFKTSMAFDVTDELSPKIDQILQELRIEAEIYIAEWDKKATERLRAEKG